jgi:5-methyltetrahydrofolate--homocysteine methyltransferase
MQNTSIAEQLKSLGSAVEKGNRDQAKELAGRILASGGAPAEVLEAMVQAMHRVGQSFECKEIFVPQMLIAARAMSETLTLLQPHLVAAGFQPKYRAVIGSVAGDMHDIGKNLVAMMWKGAGFDVIDLGANVPASRFLEVAQAERPNLVGLSALLTTTMPAMRTTIEALQPVRSEGVRVVIGGAPITQAFADDIGADGYAPDAAGAVDLAQRLLGIDG